jgi:hypothetical protein
LFWQNDVPDLDTSVGLLTPYCFSSRRSTHDEQQSCSAHHLALLCQTLQEYPKRANVSSFALSKGKSNQFFVDRLDFLECCCTHLQKLAACMYIRLVGAWNRAIRFYF